MNFVLYLLECVLEVLLGGNHSYKDSFIGLGIVGFILISYVLVVLFLDKKTNLTYRKSLIYAGLLMGGLIIIFCIVSIIIEAIIM
jgi:hypothetical protein